MRKGHLARLQEWARVFSAERRRTVGAVKGRVPRPREERIREGKTRDLPEVTLVAGRPQAGEVLEPPMKLTRDAEAWWDEVVPVLAEAGLLERVDVYVLAMA